MPSAIAVNTSRPGAEDLARSSIEASWPSTNGQGRLSDDGRAPIQPEASSTCPQTRTGSFMTNRSIIDYGQTHDPPWAFRHHKANLVRSIKRRNADSLLRRQLKQGQNDSSQNELSDKWARPDEKNDFRINLAELQRMRLRKLQCQLVGHVGYMKKFNQEPESWESDLETYSKHLYSSSNVITFDILLINTAQLRLSRTMTT